MGDLLMITREEFIKLVPIDSEIAGKSYDDLIDQFGYNEKIEQHLETIIHGFKGMSL